MAFMSDLKRLGECCWQLLDRWLARSGGGKRDVAIFAAGIP